MRTSPKTVVRRGHKRWQWCGPGRTELRRVHVRETRVTLPPTDARQMDLLEADVGAGDRRPRAWRRSRPPGPDAATRVPLRSYWRQQPHGPGNRLRRLMLVDVHA